MATIRIVGELTADSLRRFRSELAAARGDDLILEIDSIGGSAIAGLSMYADLAGWPGNTTAHVRHAGSAATLPMCACQRVIVAEDSRVVTHAPKVQAVRDIGLDVGDLREAIGSLERTLNLIAGCYAEKSGSSVEVWLARLKSEIAWKGQGIVNAGLADAVEGSHALAIAASAGRSLEDYPTPAAAEWRRMQAGLLRRARANPTVFGRPV